jgi:hypothetical protein
MKQALGLIVALALLAPMRATSSQAQSSSTNTTIDTNIVKRSIVFLTYPRTDNKTEAATGFLLSVPLKGDPTRGHSVIITARHVVDPEWAGCVWRNPEALSVRVNSKDYKPGVSPTGARETSFPLSLNGQKMWLAHSDDRVDIAAIPIANTDEAKLLDQDVNQLRVQDFVTPEEIEKYHIGIGANIISAGLVPGLWNAKRNYPAFKFGKISNIFDEPVKMRCGAQDAEKDRLSWLIAGNFVPGNSGSPIFLQPLDFTLGPPFQFNGPRSMIIGVLSGSLGDADLGEMVPIEYVFQTLEKQFLDGDFYRGVDRAKTPAPGANKP